jgi:hypothetical protein
MKNLVGSRCVYTVSKQVGELDFLHTAFFPNRQSWGVMPNLRLNAAAK